MKQYHEENSKQFENKTEDEIKSEAGEKNKQGIKSLLEKFRSNPSSDQNSKPTI